MNKEDNNIIWNKYAFISYQRDDWFPAMMLSLRMSCYHLPNDRSNEFKRSRRLIPVYRDRENLTSGDDTREKILQEVDTAKYLIVFCTRSSKEKTEWVNIEVARFLETHDINHVIPYIPPSKSKEGVYYVPVLEEAIRKKEASDPDYFFLHISHEKEELELGLLHRLFPWLFRYEKSYIRVIAKTLDYPFDSLWNAHKKFLRRLIRAIISIIFFIVLLFLYFGTTISAPIKIYDVFPNEKLPTPRNIVMKMGDAEYPLNSIDTTIVLTDIPGKYRFRKIPVILNATYYKPIKTSFNMGIGIGNKFELKMERDSTFSIFYGIVTNQEGTPIEEADVTIGNKRTSTNKNGEFRITFDITEQSETKHLYIEKVGVGCNENLYETPDSSQFVLK